MPAGSTIDGNGSAGGIPFERVVEASRLSVTVSDPNQSGHPLVWVNPGFTATTGYPADEATGRNCRFLQGPDTDPEAVAALRAAIRDGRGATVTLLNYRRDGSPFWNQVRIDPVYGADGRLAAYVGVQIDVTEERRTAEAHSDAVRAAESLRSAAEHAQSEAGRARRRLAHLTEVTARIPATLDLGEVLDSLAAAIVPEMADWVVVVLRSDGGQAAEVIVRSSRWEDAEPARELQAVLGAELTASSLLAQVLAGRPPLIRPPDTPWPAALRSSPAAELAGRLGVSASMCVPLVAQGTVIGAMALVAASPERRFGEIDLEAAAELGRRAGLIVDNARLYGREHRVAESLQRSLLPTLPVLKSFDVAARYLTADRYAEVGGDFYEVMALPDRSIAVTVGDVVGHDLAAAATMGHLRGLIRTVAWTGAEDGLTDPAQVVDRIDRLVRHLDVGPYATLFYGRLEPGDQPADQAADEPADPPRSGSSWRLRYTSAGHLPPLLRHPGGEVETLDEARGLILGAGHDPRRNTATVAVPAGAVLLAFTDGLIERRSEDIMVGYRRLAGRLALSHATIDHLLDDVVHHTGPDRRDDTAVLALRLRPAEDAPS